MSPALAGHRTELRLALHGSEGMPLFPRKLLIGPQFGMRCTHINIYYDDSCKSIKLGERSFCKEHSPSFGSEYRLISG